MPLTTTLDNPPPPGAETTDIFAADGVRLRTVRWIPGGDLRGTVSILGGRGEFAEKYFEVARELLARRFAVATMDWRGQGASERSLPNDRKGHVDDFADFERDLDAFEREILAPYCPGPWLGLAHSMGGAIVLATAEAGRCPFERLVTTSPMIGLVGFRRPRAAHALASVFDALGLGGAFIPGGGSTSASTAPFDGNPLTSDPARYARTAAVIAAAPSIALGAPTIGWIHAAFRLMRRFEDPAFPRALRTPTLIVAAGEDRVTDTRAAERFAIRMRAGRLVVIEGAEHEILMERDSFRARFWSAFDAFAPGGPSLAAAAAEPRAA